MKNNRWSIVQRRGGKLVRSFAPSEHDTPPWRAGSGDAGATVARVLFVCVENSNRSQMAEAFARVRGAGVLDAQSAGSSPSGTVSPRAIEAMAELGCDLSSHTSKGLSEVGSGPFDYVITMGCGDACPSVKAACREDWTLPDPRSMSDEEFRAVRDEIARRVDELVERVRSSRSQSC